MGVDKHSDWQEAVATAATPDVLATLAESIPGTVYRCKCDKAWTMLFISTTVADYTGSAPREFLEGGRGFVDIIHPDDVEAVDRKILQAVDNREPYSLEYRLVHRDGAILWMHERGRAVYDDHGNVLYLDGVLLDITERKRMEQAMQSILEGTAAATGGEFFHSLVHHLARALKVRYAFIGELISTNRVRTQTVWAGDGFAENFEYDLVGTPCENVVRTATCFYPSGVQDLFPNDHILTDLGVESYLGTPLSDAEGNTQGLLVVMDDRPMTGGRLARRLLPVFAARAGAELGRRRAEEQQARLQTQLRQAQKMEAVGQLAGGVAHDFNNLLQVIRGYTELSLAIPGVDDPVRTNLQEVAKAANRAAMLVDQLLAFSRRESIRPEPLDINSLVADVIQMLRRIIGEQIELRVISDPDLQFVLADRTQLQQVLLNLCVNARDAMAQGGVLTIRTASDHVDEPSCHDRPWSTPSDYVTISVADTGTGIEPELRERIFEPFFTTKDVGEGTGLGLATVYGIVEQHSGWVEVDSTVGAGSTFRVFLPACPPPEPSATAPSVEPSVVGGHETILLAEDDDLVRNLNTTVLQGAGYRVLVARDGEEAMDVWHKHRDTIELAILDVVMPKRGGRDVFNAIAVGGRDIPVLFSTGYDYSALEDDYLPTGCAVLQKPYSPTDLLRRVRQMLRPPA